MYIPIDHRQSTIKRVAVQILLHFQGKQAWDWKETLVKYWQSQG
jgi:hypothetical protein